MRADKAIVPDELSAVIISSSPVVTKKYGMLLGQTLRQGIVIGLVGELGAGKTTFTQGLAQGLGMPERVPSPTFTLINQYIAPTNEVYLFHVDSYRLADEALVDQLYGLGIDEIFDASEDDPVPHVVVIEWADRLADLLPADRLMISFGRECAATTGTSALQVCQALHHVDVEGGSAHERVLTFRSMGTRSRTLLSGLMEKIDEMVAQSVGTQAEDAIVHGA